MYMGYNSGSQVKLSDYICDLNLKITDEGYGCVPLTNSGFAYMWAGAKANYGVRSGRVCFEVKIEENLPVDIKDNTDIHIVRVGWSTDAAILQLGEDKQSYGFGGTGMKSEDRKFVPYGRKFTKGDVVSCYLAIVNGWADISFAVNGQSCGSAFKLRWNRGEAFYPHILTKNCKLLVNFGMNANPYYSLLPGYKFIDSLPPELKVASVVAPTRKAECEVIMMVGLPGVGKSTWAENYTKIHPSKKYNVLGTDAIIDKMRVLGLRRQNNFGGRWDVLIKEATECFNTLLAQAAKMNRNLILDQTNVYSSARRRKVKQFQDAGFVVNAMILVPTDQDMISRSQKRTREEGKEIPVDAILDMKANFSLPDESEGLFRSITYLELQQDAAVEVVKNYNREAEGKGHRSNVSRQRSYNRNQLEKSIGENKKLPTNINNTANKPQQSSYYSPTKPEFIPLISDRKRHDPREHRTPPEKVPRYSDNTKSNTVKEESPPPHAKAKNEYSEGWNEYNQYGTGNKQQAAHTEDYNPYDQQFDEYYQEKSEKVWENKNNPPNRPGNHGDGPNFKPPNSRGHNDQQQPADQYYKEENYNNNQSSDSYYKDNNAEYHNNERQWDEGYSNQDYEGYGQEGNQTYQNDQNWENQNWDNQQYTEENQHDLNNQFGGYQDEWNQQISEKSTSHDFPPQNDYQQHHMETNDHRGGQYNDQREQGRPSTDDQFNRDRDPRIRNMAPNNNGPRNVRPGFAPRGMGPLRPRFNSQMDAGSRSMAPPPRNMGPRPRSMGPRPPNMGKTPGSMGPRARNLGPGPRNLGPRSTAPAPRNMGPGNNNFNSISGNMRAGSREPDSRYSPSGAINAGPPPRNMTPGPRIPPPGSRIMAPSPGPRNIAPGPRNIAPGPRNTTPGSRDMAPGTRNVGVSGQIDFLPDARAGSTPPRNMDRGVDPRNSRPDIKAEEFPNRDMDPYAERHGVPDRQGRRDDMSRGEEGKYDQFHGDRHHFDDRGRPPPYEILPDGQNRRPPPQNQFDRGPPREEGIQPRPGDRGMNQEERNFHPRDGPRTQTHDRARPPPADGRRLEEPQQRRESTESGSSLNEVHPDLPKLTPLEIEALKASLTQFRKKKNQEPEKPRSHDSRESERDSRPRSSSRHDSRRSREHERSRDRHSDRHSKEHGDHRRDDRDRSRRHRDDERERSENRHKSDRGGNDRSRREDHGKRERRRSRSRERSRGQSHDHPHDRPPSNDRRDQEEYHEPPRKPLLDTPIEHPPPPQHPDDQFGHPNDQFDQHHEEHYDQYDDQGYQEYPMEAPEEFPPQPKLMTPSQFLQAQGKLVGIRPPPRAVIGPRLQKERAHAANMRAQEMAAMHRMPMHNEGGGRHDMNHREMAEQHLRSIERNREADMRPPDVRGRPLNDQEVQLVQNLELKERLEQQRNREEMMKSEPRNEQLTENMPPNQDMDPGFQHGPRMPRKEMGPPFYSPPRRGMGPPRRGMPMRGPPRHIGHPRMPRYRGNPPHMSDGQPVGLLGEKPPDL